MLTLLRNGRIHSAADPEATAPRLRRRHDQLDRRRARGRPGRRTGPGGRPARRAGGAGFRRRACALHRRRAVVDRTRPVGHDSLAACLALVGQFAADHRRPASSGGTAGTRPGGRRTGRPPGAEIDAAVGGRPAYLARVDVHSAAVSTALAAAYRDGPARDGWHPDTARHQGRAPRRPITGQVAARRAATRPQRSRRSWPRCAQRGIVEVHECAAADEQGRADLVGLLALDSPISVLGYLGAAVDDPEQAVDLLAETGARPWAATSWSTARSARGPRRCARPTPTRRACTARGT